MRSFRKAGHWLQLCNRREPRRRRMAIRTRCVRTHDQMRRFVMFLMTRCAARMLEMHLRGLKRCDVVLSPVVTGRTRVVADMHERGCMARRTVIPDRKLMCGVQRTRAPLYVRRNSGPSRYPVVPNERAEG